MSVYEANFLGLLKEIQDETLWGEDLKTTAWLTESSGWMTTTEPTTVESTTQELITGIVKECDDQDLCDYEGSAESDMVKSEFSHQKNSTIFRTMIDFTTTKMLALISPQITLARR